MVTEGVRGDLYPVEEWVRIAWECGEDRAEEGWRGVDGRSGGDVASSSRPIGAAALSLSV